MIFTVFSDDTAYADNPGIWKIFMRGDGAPVLVYHWSGVAR